MARWRPVLLAPLLIGAAKPVLVPDVSQDAIEIHYSFTGAKLLLFGAILYPGGRLPDERADIAIVVKGPTQSVVLREKRKIAGMWMNAGTARYRSAPSFYAIASSRPLPKIIDQNTADIYELGLSSLQLSPSSGTLPVDQTRYTGGLVDLLRREGLYVERPTGVTISDGVLYRAEIDIPARVPVGRYTAETFLIEDGRVLAGAVKEIAIGKSGFERFVAIAASRWSFAYGVVAVFVSLLIGWGASLPFRRR